MQVLSMVHRWRGNNASIARCMKDKKTNRNNKTLSRSKQCHMQIVIAYSTASLMQTMETT